MSKQPEQEGPGLKGAASGPIVPRTPPGVAGGDIISPGVHGPFDPEPAFEDERSTGVSPSRLLRSKWMILGIFALLSGATIPWIWLLVKPTYQATAIVRVSPVVPRIVFRTEENVNAMGSLFTSFLNTQVLIIQSPTVLQRVLDQPDVQATTWYRTRPRTLRTLLGSDPPTSFERLQNNLSVAPRPRTELIEVSMTTAVAKDSAVIVGAVVNEYKRLADETLRKTDIERFDTLTSEHRALQKEVEGLVATKFNLSQSLGTVDPKQLRSQLATHLSVLAAEYERLKREYSMTQWELESRSPVADETEGTDGAAGKYAETDEPSHRYADDVEWRKLRLDLGSARDQLELARQRYGESHPRIKELLASVAHATRKLRERDEQLTKQWAGAVAPVEMIPDGSVVFLDRAALERLAGRQGKELELLGEEIERQRTRVTEAGDIAKQIAHYEEETNQKRELRDTVRSRLQVLEMEAKAPARISVAAQPVVPSQPRRDRRFLLTVMALGGAMMTGLVAAYWRATVNPKISEAGDVTHVVRVPFLGQLPRLNAADALNGGAGPLALESMRMVRTALLEHLGETDDRVVLITSSSGRVGKTSVAIGLARSLANLGKRTLLVEADLRRPSLSKRLGLESGAGLAALLDGTAKDSDVIVPSRVPRLDVLLAGEQPADFDAELLANGVFAAHLNQWKTSYDFIVLDGPPVLPVADARILAGQADGTVLLLRSSHCRRNEVIQTYAHLSTAGVRLLGTVLVGVPHEACYGYDGNFGAYYRGSSVGETRPTTDGDS